jgi:uncharacterized protein with GYD domain
MATYVVLTKFTDQGIRNAKDSPKRAEARLVNGHNVAFDTRYAWLVASDCR